MGAAAEPGGKMSSLEGQFLYNIPSDIMCRFCEVIATLEDSDWTTFASRIVHDVTRLRLLERKSRHERTRDLMWYWVNKNALVGDLLRLLNDLKLLRARDIILSWRPDAQMRQRPDEHYYRWGFNPSPPAPPDPGPPPKPAPCQQNLGVRPKSSSTAQTEPLGSTECSLKSLPTPFSPPESLLHSSVAGSTCSSVGRSSIGRSSICPSSVGSKRQAPSQAEELCSRVPAVQTPHPLVWTLQELAEGTKNFSPSQMIGEGGFGHVYKATMRNTDYAIKKLKKDSELEWSTVKQSFLTEVEKLSGLRHPNIIDLAGYCMEEDVYCLVYLYLPNGSLEGRLHRQGEGTVLSWQQRLAILLGVARALQFLHFSQPSLIHGDVKSSNILLDEQLTPKLGDFGLARFRLAQTNTGKRSTAMWTRMVRGTLAYLPDEYVKMGKLTLELDTYSFGVVLLENLTGQNAIQSEGHGKTKYLKDVVKEEEATDQEEMEERKRRDPSFSEPPRDRKAMRTGVRIYRKYLDRAAGPWPEEVGVDLCQLACQCLDNQKKRPKMVEVFKRLERLHDLLRRIPEVGDSSSVQGATEVSSKELPSPVANLSDRFKDMLLTPEENTFKYSPGWPGCVPTDNQPMARPSQEQSGRTTGGSDSQRHLAPDPSQFRCLHPRPVHMGHGNSSRISLPVYPSKLDSFLGVTLRGQCFRTLPHDVNQPVESDESLSDACLSLSSRYQQCASPLSHDSGQGQSLSPAGCKATGVRRHSAGTPVECQQPRQSSLPAQGQCCYQLAEEQEVALSQSRAEASNSKGSALPCPASQNGPPREIIMNPAKERIVQKLVLYEQGTIDSLELLNSGTNPGFSSVARGARTPEESDEFSC